MATTAVVHSSFLFGLDAVLLDVRCTARTGGRRDLDLVGASASGAKELSVRVRSALAAVGAADPGSAAIELSPAPTSTAQLDLAVAIALLAASGVISAPHDLLVLGELGLDGSVRAVRGTLASALAARAAGLRGVIVPAASAGEAALVDGLAIYAVADLTDALRCVQGSASPGDPSYLYLIGSAGEIPAASPAQRASRVDLADVRGQAVAVDAFARAVAQGDRVLLSGPPGTGKTMLARRLSTLLPGMTRDERLSVVRAYSAVGLAGAAMATDERPFRAPHHSISTPALVGEAGRARRPGELQLSACGVLYLDELTEFSRGALTSLAGALDQMEPAVRPRIVASANPCPCGWFGASARACTCSADAVVRHVARVRAATATLGIQTTVEVPAISLADLRATTHGRSSAELRALVWRPTWRGELVAVSDVVAAYLGERSGASFGDVLEHVRTICPAWGTMRDDVTKACDLWATATQKTKTLPNKGEIEDADR